MSDNVIYVICGVVALMYLVTTHVGCFLAGVASCMLARKAAVTAPSNIKYGVVGQKRAEATVDDAIRKAKLAHIEALKKVDGTTYSPPTEEEVGIVAGMRR